MKFADLREYILKGRLVSVETLQRFAGKITSFSISPYPQLNRKPGKFSAPSLVTLSLLVWIG